MNVGMKTVFPHNNICQSDIILKLKELQKHKVYVYELENDLIYYSCNEEKFNTHARSSIHICEQ